MKEEKDVSCTGATEAEANEKESLVIKFAKPYRFEGKEYTEIDLEALADLTGADLIAVDKLMSRDGISIEVMPEVKINYACNLAAKALKLPVEFFEGLPAKEAIKVKNRVMGFLLGSD